MKTTILLLTTALLLLMGCKSSSTVRGLENESFLEIVGTASDYRGGVDVDIDDKISFKATVCNASASNSSIAKSAHVIPAGVHTVTVSYNGKTIYKKQIFVSAQETKRIILQ